jgi:hypothetical protein
MPTPGTERALEKPQAVRRVVFTKPYDIEGKERVFVIPPTVHLDYENPPKTIEFVNQTGGPVTIWLAAAGHFLKLRKDPETHVIQEFIKPFDVSTKVPLVFDVKEKLPKGCYEYNVYCEEIKDYAQGNSSPNISCP